MAWELLRVDYVDAVWDGYKKYALVNNPDGTISLQDVTVYTVYDKAFFGADDANKINTAVNAILASLENGTDLYEVFTNWFEVQKTDFDNKANLDLDSFEVFLDQLKATANSDITKMKNQYTTEIKSFESQQENLFTQWFDLIKGQLSSDVAGNLQLQINTLMQHVRNLAVKLHIINMADATGVNVIFTNDTTGTVYTISDFNNPTYITEAGTYTASCTNESYMVTPKHVIISNENLMTDITLKLMDGNGLAFVDGYVGAYVNN